jgi:hypothetical protein
MPPLTTSQIDQLIAQGCRAADWATVTVDVAADLTRIRAVQFLGVVTVGANRSDVLVDGVQLPCGLYDATIADCAIGADVRIARVGSAVSRYNIADGAVIQDVAALVATDGATFGAGTDVGVVNEAGGRVVRLLPSLSSQSAYLQAFRSHSKALTAAVRALVDAEVAAARTGRGEVGAHARVLHCGPIHDVHIGPHALVRGVARLEDGTILSCAEHPTLVAEAVQARHFVIAEGASVASGALLDKVFVGQACKVGKQYSAEDSVFFANCELFHGEAVAAFGGPYTVTHHKGTLLIAAGFSFYNAGSGTNQSNHMYKLGPVHQGVFERGTKTGSFSYVLHETHVGPFSVIIGKHYTNINTPDLPFSYIHESEGRTEIVPGMNLFSVGTVRDGEKWPKRDGRKAPVRRDLISFAVFSPFTVEKMRAGRAALRHLQETTPKEKSAVHYGGVVIKRLLFNKCGKYYAQGITRYLAGRIFDRIEAAPAASTWRDVQQALQPAAALREPLAWTDMGGLLLPVERLRALETAIVDGSLASLAAVHDRLAAIAAAYDSDEWEYVCAAFAQEHGVAPHDMSREQAVRLLADYDAAASGLHGKIADDSRKEFDAVARISYGLDMSDDERAAEFAAVRGSADTNPVVQALVHEQGVMAERLRRLGDLLASF